MEAVKPNLKLDTITISKASSLKTKKHTIELLKAVWNTRDAEETLLLNVYHFINVFPRHASSAWQRQ